MVWGKDPVSEQYTFKTLSLTLDRCNIGQYNKEQYLCEIENHYNLEFKNKLKQSVEMNEKMMKQHW